MGKENFVIIIPGLGDEISKIAWATRFWQNHGLKPMVHSVGWRNGEDFQPKLERLVGLVDKLSGLGNVSIVGTSAGGSAALNAFYERPEVIKKAVNVCGRLRVGTHDGIHSFESKTSTSPAFAQSVVLCEAIQKGFTSKERQRIMTIHAKYGDELVPANTTTIEGATNITVPTLEHMFSIAMAVTLLSKPLLEFLKSE